MKWSDAPPEDFEWGGLSATDGRTRRLKVPVGTGSERR